MTGTQQRSDTVDQTRRNSVLQRLHSRDHTRTVSQLSRKTRLPTHLQRFLHIPLSPSISLAADSLLGVSQKMATITLKSKGSGGYAKRPSSNRAETLSAKEPATASPDKPVSRHVGALRTYDTNSEPTWAIELRSNIEELRRPHVDRAAG